MLRRDVLLGTAAWLGAARLGFAAECECPPPPDGEDPVLALRPKLYLKMDDAEGVPADSAGAGYSGLVEISGAPSYRVATPQGAGIRLGDGGGISIAHDVVFATAGADKPNVIVESEATFSVHCGFPAPLQNDMQILSKVVDGIGLSLRVHKTGAVELRVQDHKYRPFVRMWAPAGTVKEEGWHHFTVSLGHRGAWFTVDGCAAEDGFRNTLAWWALDHRHNGVEEYGRAESVRELNTAPITIGIGADIVVSRFAVFHAGATRTAYGQITQGLTLDDIQELAGEAGNHLCNPRFADKVVDVTPGTNTIQAAIDEATPNGTVTLASGTYILSKDIVLKQGVRITSKGALLNFTNDAKITSPKPEAKALTGGGDLLSGARSYAVPNSLSDNAVFVTIDKTPLQELYRVKGMHNARVRKSDMIPIRARTDQEIFFGRAPFFSYRENNRLATFGYEPTADVQIDGKITLRKDGGKEENNLVTLYALRRARFHGITIEQISTKVPYLLAAIFYGCVEVTLAGCKVTTVSPQGPDGTRHPYAMKFAGCANYDVSDHVGHSNAWHAVDNEADNLGDTWGEQDASKEHFSGQFGTIRHSKASTLTNNFPVICHTANHITMLDLDFTSGGGTSIDGYAHNIETIRARPNGRKTQISHSRGVGATRIWHCQFNNTLGNWGNGGYGMTKCDYGDLHYKDPVQTSMYTPVPHDGSNVFWNVDRAIKGFPF